MSVSAEHENLVRHFVESDGWSTGPLRKAIRRFVQDSEWYDADVKAEAEDLVEEGRIHFVPDAFRLRWEGQEKGWGHPVLVVEVLEVIRTNRLSPAKEAALADFWWTCDSTEGVAFRAYCAYSWRDMEEVISADRWTPLIERVFQRDAKEES